MNAHTSLFFVSVLLVIVILTLPSCAEQTINKSSFMMDTVISYNVTARNADKLIAECDGTVSDLESRLSAHIPTSEVGMFNSRGSVTLSDDAREITNTALDIYRNTNGAFDITVAPLVSLWDITHGKDSWTPPKDEDISAVLTKTGSDRLFLYGCELSSTSEGTNIDLGGIAKGYALGKCAEYLSDNGASGTLSFGGSIALVGSKDNGKPWVVGVKDPFSPDTLCGSLSLETGIISVSGGYERYREYGGVRYHHIIDPKTGYPSSSDLACALVVCPSADPLSGALCDALSTALFVMGRDAALSLYESGIYNFEAVLVMNDGSITVTKGLEGRFEPYAPQA